MGKTPAKTAPKTAPRVFGEDAQEAFLTLVGNGWAPSRAAEQIRVNLRTIESKKGRDKDFADAYRVARRAGAEVVLGEMQRRGVEGWMEPVYYQGAVVGHVRKYSDRALSDLARGLVPDMFDPRVHVELNVEAALTVQHLVELRAVGRDEEAHADLELLADEFVALREGKATAEIPAETQ